MKQDPYYRYFKMVLVFSIAICVFMVLLNYYTDPYKVFHRTAVELDARFEPNTRFIKTEYLAENCQQFDAYIFGASRSVAYRTEAINKQFNVNSYNYSVSDDTPLGALQKLKWLVAHGCPVRKIFLPVSVDRIKIIDYAVQDSLLLRMEHPLISGKPFSQSVANFLMSPDVTRLSLRTHARQLAGHEYQFKYNFNSGDVSYLWDDDVDIKDCSVRGKSISEKNLTEYMQILSQTNLFAISKGVDVILLWNPQPVSIQLAYNITVYENLLGRLEKIFPLVYRVNVEDKRLDDSSYYHDPSHFKASLANAVIESQNRIAFSQLLSEFRLAIQQCELL